MHQAHHPACSWLVGRDAAAVQEPPAFNFRREYLYQDKLYDLRGRPLQEPRESGPSGGSSATHRGRQWALLTFHQPVTAPEVGLRSPGLKLDVFAGPHLSCSPALLGVVAASHLGEWFWVLTLVSGACMQSTYCLASGRWQASVTLLAM